MRRREWIFFGLCAAAYVAARGPAALVGPFILPFENAFQEAIALHHLGHVFDNRFLPVLARIDGVNFYHTAHPPLLHLFYAGLYSVFGTAEWVTRAAALALYLASVLLWRRTGADADEPGWPLYPLALFLPVPFVLATTTNYEPLSIFFVSLIFYLGEALECGDSICGSDLQVATPEVAVRRPLPQDKKGGDRSPHSKVWLVVALTFGMLTDWPVYLAVPALLIRHWREPRRRNLYLALIAFEAVFLALLLGYMYLVAGEVALFGHAAQRANPVGLFSPALWRELGSHWLELSGAAATIVATVAVIAVAAFALRAPRTAGLQPGSSSSAPSPASAFELFALFTIILVLAAPQLVSRHHVYLLYFAPPVALALKDLILRVDQKKLAVLALVVLFAAPNYIVRYQRNPAYWAMAERVKGTGIKTAFASAAIGAWYYYAGIETVFPMSAAAGNWVRHNRPVLMHLDTRSREVNGDQSLSDNGYYVDLFFLPGEKVLKDIATYITFPAFFYPRSDLSWNFSLVDGVPFPGIQEHAAKSDLLNDYPEGCGVTALGELVVRPVILHSLPGVKSDGVQFLLWEDSGNKTLRYSRFVDDNRPPQPVSLDVNTDMRIKIATTPGPKNKDAFDDAWWLFPESK